MFHIVLVEPQIPPNTGNIIRLCANTGSQLHLIHPLGFELDDKRCRRAGLDYHEFASVKQHESFEAFLKQHTGRLFAIETCGNRRYSDVSFQPEDAFVFGSESTIGLSEKVLTQFDQNHVLQVPMKPNIRSLNLSNCVAVVVYEAWRQIDFSL